MSSLTDKSDDELREIFNAARQTLAALTDSFNTVRRFRRKDDLLKTINERVVMDPDLVRLFIAGKRSSARESAASGSD